MMVWHILKKDLRLQWLLAVTLVIAQFAQVAVDLQLGHFHRDDSALRSLQLLLQVLIYFGAGAFIVALTHHDALVDMRKDWLARPIRRRDLLLAKLALISLIVQLPLLVAQCGEGLAAGFPFLPSFSAAFSENLWFLMAFTLPLLALAAITRNMTQAIAAAASIFLAVVCGQAILQGLKQNTGLGPDAGSAMLWVYNGLQLLVFFFGTAVILALQYFRRNTRVSIAVFAIVVAFLWLDQVIPWQLAFRAQMLATIDRAAANHVALRVDTSRAAFADHSGDIAALRNTAASRNAGSANSGETRILLPIAATGLPDDSILRIDRAAIRLVPLNGQKPILLGSGAGSGFEIAASPIAGNTSPAQLEPVPVKSSIYRQWKDVPVTLVIDDSITLIKLSSVHEIAATSGDARFADAGWCRTAFNESRNMIEARCLQPGDPPQCVTFILEDPASGARNPEVHGCRSNYVPWFGRYKPLSTITDAGANLPFRDPSGLLHYPVDTSRLANAKVVLRTYQPVAHFHRSLTVPHTRLADWATE